VFELSTITSFLAINSPWGLCGALLLIGVWKDKVSNDAICDRTRSTALLEAMATNIKENSALLGRLIDIIARDK
jgi:hypothetical protein